MALNYYSLRKLDKEIEELKQMLTLTKYHNDLHVQVEAKLKSLEIIRKNLHEQNLSHCWVEE